jgi:transposase
MAKPIVSDELWAVVEPLLPPEPAKPKGGRPRISNLYGVSSPQLAAKSILDE